MLKLENVACGYGSRIVLKDVSLEVHEGEVMCILGANGAGKTTLFKTVLGHLPILAGSVTLKGRNMLSMSVTERAKEIGYVPQAHTPPFPFSVRDVVAMGRTAHLSLFASPSDEDMEIAEEALHKAGVAYLTNRIYTEISGGERQLVLIARALAQTPSILIMDEPTSNLDFGNQARAVQQVRKLADRGLGVVMTTHFPDHVFMCADKVAVIKKTDEVIVGDVKDVMTQELLSELYHMPIRTINVESKTVCVPMMGR